MSGEDQDALGRQLLAIVRRIGFLCFAAGALSAAVATALALGWRP